MTPPGWTYNPSTWSERLPLIGLAVLGFAVAGYLALVQLGSIARAWEPFFGRGSETILHSGVSRLLPVPDAALGAAGYLLDAVSGAVGGRERWRTMPWIVVVFGIAVGPLGAVSLLLVALIVWSTWGLARDSLNLALDAVPPGIDPDEVSALLGGLDGVMEVHDLHIWGMSTTDVALTAHLVRPCGGNEDAVLAEATRELRERFGIAHATIQLERGLAIHACELAPPDRV